MQEKVKFALAQIRAHWSGRSDLFQSFREIALCTPERVPGELTGQVVRAVPPGCRRAFKRKVRILIHRISGFCGINAAQTGRYDASVPLSHSLLPVA